MLSYVGHNMRIILKKIRIFCAHFCGSYFLALSRKKTMSLLTFWSYRPFAGKLPVTGFFRADEVLGSGVSFVIAKWLIYRVVLTL